MTKLESIEHKIFASEAPLDEIGQFGSALDTTKLNTKDVTTIQALPAYTKGWGSAVISDSNYPTMEEMNGVLNVMSYHTGYLYQEGIPVWRNDREYSATSIVKEPTGTKLFHSLKDGNIGNALDNTEYWEELKLGGSGLEVCDIGMALYVDETKGLRRYLNGQIVDINTNTQAFLNRLLEIKNTNPDYFTTEENWQSEATLNIDGCVYKFVLNYASDGETVVSVRLPKYPDYVEINAGGTLPVVGNGMTLGLTDGTSSHNGGSIGWYSGELRGNYSQQNLPVGPSLVIDSSKYFTNNTLIGVATDPTKSGIQTTLKQTKLKMRYFIQIATGSETENNIVNDIELNNPYSLFDSKYSDHELNNISWLKSEGQWNAKAVYPTAYDKLLKVYNGTETVEGLSVKLSTETYTDYDFVLNTADETFRLPLRNGKEGMFGNIPVVGNGMTLGLNEGTKNFGLYTINNYISEKTTLYGASVGTSYTSSADGTQGKSIGVTTDPTKSGLVTNSSSAIVPYGWKLYFYVGETVQNANLIDAGRIGEQVANCITRNDCKAYITETYKNGTSWYRIYSDGWCEQGGATADNVAAPITVTLLKAYINNLYSVQITINGTASSPNINNYPYQALGKTASSFIVANYGSGPGDNNYYQWEACGYIR